MSEEFGYKVIVALKFSSDLPQGLKCLIQAAEKQRSTNLPLEQGQFFDLVDLPCESKLFLSFSNAQGERLYDLEIDVPSQVYSQEETELADTFKIMFQEKGKSQQFQGSYYVIILNKKIFLQRTNQHKKQVQFLDDQISDKRIKTQQTKQNNKGHSTDANEIKKSPPKKSKVQQENKRPTSIKDKINETVQRNVSLIKNNPALKPYSLNDTLAEKSIDNSLETPNSYTSTLVTKNTSQNLNTPREEQNKLSIVNEELVRNVTPIKQTGTKPQQNYSAFSKSPSPMQKQDSCQSVEHLKYIIWSLDQKLQQSYQNQRIDDLMKQELQTNEKLKEELYIQISEANKKCSNLQKEYIDIQQEQQQKQELLQQQISERALQNAKVQSENSSLLLKIKHHELEVVEHQKRIEESRIQEQRIANLECCITQLNGFNLQLKEDINQFSQKRQQEIPHLEAQIVEANQQKWSLNNQLQETSFELQRVKQQLEQKEIQLLTYERHSTSEFMPLQRQVCQLMEEQQIYLKHVADLKYQNQGLVQAVDQLKLQLTKNQQKRIEEERQQCDVQETLKRKLVEKDNQVSQLNQFIQQIKLQNQNLKVQNQGLRQYEDIYNELNCEFTKLKNKMHIVVDANDQLNEKLDDAALVRQVILDDQMLQQNRISELEIRIQDQDVLLANLKKMLFMLQREKGSYYIPIQNDQIDKRVANYINEKDDRFRVSLFMLLLRDSEGVYTFGLRKLFLKLEQDKVLVKTGGGFVRMDQFFDGLVIENELDKFEKSFELIPKKEKSGEKKKAHITQNSLQLKMTSRN